MSTILPTDILKTILDVVALQESKTNFLRLFRVSRAVKECAEYHVYSSLVLKTREQVIRFAEALDGGFTFCKPNYYVRHLWVLYSDEICFERLQDITEKCPNLLRFAFEGTHFPVKRPGQLSMLSLLSPSQVKIPQPIYEKLTHLHILGPGDIIDTNFYATFLSSHLNQLTSLQELCIEFDFPSPEQQSLNHQLYAETALFYLYLEDELLRNMLKTLPSLCRIVVKSAFPFPRFRVLWKQLSEKFIDEDRVVFRLEDPKDNGNECFDFSDSHLVWAQVICHSLRAIDQQWFNEPLNSES